jgi:MinD-like ATPase involved in chromosome partitioning or flagellar assembly
VIVVLVVAAGAAWESPALELVASRQGMVVLKRCVDVEELLATSSAGQADAAVVALDAPGLDPTAMDVLRRHQLRVVAVGPDSDAARTRAARLGVDALLSFDRLDSLPDALEAHAGDASDDRRRPVGPADGDPASDGRVVAVWGPAGAPGRTTVAVSLASVLARRGLSTTLVDADPYGGTVAAHLGILDEVSGLLSVTRLSADGLLDERLASAQRSVGDRLNVVTGLPRGDRWVEVRPGVVEHLLEVASTRGHVVVDTGFGLEEDPAGDLGARPARNQLTFGALDLADEILVVGTADPVGLARLARGLVDLRERLPGVDLRVVVNRMRNGLGWPEREILGMVEGFAQVSDVHFLPDDRAATDRALSAGVSVVESGESELARALVVLGEAVVPPAVPRRRVARRHPRLRLVSVRRRTADTARRR